MTTLTPRQVIAVLILQGATIPCYRCGEPILRSEDCQREHLHEKALGGSDAIANARFSHAACHAIITDGPPQCSAGSSKNRIAKAKRIAREEKMIVHKYGRTVKAWSTPPWPTRWPSRPMPGSRDSGWKQPFKGKAERRT